jgi:hypothetical protein
MQEKQKKVANVSGKVSFAETEDEDLFYWSDKSIKERLEELYEWNKKVWMKINGSYPLIIAKEGGKVSKINLDEDDF